MIQYCSRELLPKSTFSSGREGARVTPVTYSLLEPPLGSPSFPDRMYLHTDQPNPSSRLPSILPSFLPSPLPFPSLWQGCLPLLRNSVVQIPTIFSGGVAELSLLQCKSLVLLFFNVMSLEVKTYEQLKQDIANWWRGVGRAQQAMRYRTSVAVSEHTFALLTMQEETAVIVKGWWFTQ